MRTDYGTTGYAQWFYFKISNVRKNQTYQFNIMNMLKPDFLYNQGMKILSYSEKRAEECRTSWRRDGSDIGYFRNSIKRNRIHYYTLSFTITAECIFLNSYLKNKR